MRPVEEEPIRRPAAVPTVPVPRFSRLGRDLLAVVLLVLGVCILLALALTWHWQAAVALIGVLLIIAGVALGTG